MSIRALSPEEEILRATAQEEEEQTLRTQQQQLEEEKKRLTAQILGRSLQFFRSTAATTETSANSIPIPPAILFLASHNLISCQIAAALCHVLHSHSLSAFTCNNHFSDFELDELVIELLNDENVDLKTFRLNQSIEQSTLPSRKFNYIVTVDSEAQQQLDELFSNNQPNRNPIHHSLPDLQLLVQQLNSGEVSEKQQLCRQIISEIKDFVNDLPDLLL